MGSTVSSSTATHRLIIAGAAGLVLFSLGWAGIQVRERQTESQRLRDQFAAGEISRREGGAASRAHPPADARIAEMERQLAAFITDGKLAAEKAAAREKELEGIITFLRQENTAAQQTIERLSALQPPPEPAPEPVVEVRKPVEKRRAGRP